MLCHFTPINRSVLIPVLSRGQRAKLRGMLALWICTLLLFFGWWLNPSHVVDPGAYAVTTIIVTWWLLLPGYYFFFLIRMRKPDPHLPVPPGWRAAMVVTKASSE